MSLAKFEPEFTGVACSVCYDRLDKRFKRGTLLNAVKPRETCVKGYANSYKFRPCSVPDCPDPMGGNRKKPWLMPRRMSLSKFGDGLQGVACSTCYARINKRFNRGDYLFTLEQIMGPCFETAACLQMHDRKRFLAMSLPVLNLPFTLDDLRGRAWTAAVLADHKSLTLEEVIS